MSDAFTDPPFGTEGVEAPRAFRRVASERITVVNAVQNVVGAYLSPIQIEDVATAVLSALRREP